MDGVELALDPVLMVGAVADDGESAPDSMAQSIPAVTHEEEVAVAHALMQIDSPEARRIVAAYQERCRRERSWIHRIVTTIRRIWRWIAGRTG